MNSEGKPQYREIKLKDATAGPRHPELGDGYQAALVNFGYMANEVVTTEEIVNRLPKFFTRGPAGARNCPGLVVQAGPWEDTHVGGSGMMGDLQTHSLRYVGARYSKRSYSEQDAVP